MLPDPAPQYTTTVHVDVGGLWEQIGVQVSSAQSSLPTEKVLLKQCGVSKEKTHDPGKVLLLWVFFFSVFFSCEIKSESCEREM